MEALLPHGSRAFVIKRKPGVGGYSVKHKKGTRILGLTKRQFIITIVSVCVTAIVVEAILLIHTFSKKKPAKKPEPEPTVTEQIEITAPPTVTPDTYSVWRPTKRYIIDGNEEKILMYEYGYDNLGRQTLYIWYETDGVTAEETYVSIYLEDGGRIEELWVPDRNGELRGTYYYPPGAEYWHPTLGSAYIKECVLDDSGKIKKLDTLLDWNEPRMEPYPAEWLFENGRVTGINYPYEAGEGKYEPWVIRYNSDGLVSKVFKRYSDGSGEIAESFDITYDGDAVTVTDRSGNGEYYLTEYKKGYMVHDLTSKIYDDGSMYEWDQRFIWPKGNFPDEIRFGFCGRETSYTNEDGKKIADTVTETDENGQPTVCTSYLSDESILSVATYYYDESGMLKEIVREGTDTTEKDSFEFDENGNLIFWDSDGVRFVYEWEEFKIPVGQGLGY